MRKAMDLAGFKIEDAGIKKYRKRVKRNRDRFRIDCHPLVVTTVSTSGSLTLQSVLIEISDVNEDSISTGNLESRILVASKTQEK